MANKYFTNALHKQLLGCQVVKNPAGLSKLHFDWQLDGSAHKRLSGGGTGMVAVPCLVACCYWRVNG